MKLQVTQENLSRALTSVSRVASSRGTLPILANVLLKTVDGRLSIAATNLDIAITHFIGAKIGESGAITVPARLMQDFVSSLPGGIIELELNDYKLHISTEQYNSVINGVSAEDYPVMPAIAEGTHWKIPAGELKRGLQEVVFAASSDESRPVLTGVYMHTTEGRLYLAATDSYRLAEQALTDMKETVSLLIPANALNDLLRILNDDDMSVEITHDDQQVLFQVGDVELVTRLIEGKYPDYRKLIPAEFAVTAMLKRADLMNITKVSSLFARESAGSVTINFSEMDKKVSIRSVASQLGENTAEAEAVVTGEGTITLNSRYIMDALHALSGEQVQVACNGKLDPCVVTDPEAPDSVHLVMPLKS
jgi:DNA polymerase-3 subunit beta